MATVGRPLKSREVDVRLRQDLLTTNTKQAFNFNQQEKGPTREQVVLHIWGRGLLSLPQWPAE